jgi:hypothetical protein
VSDIPILGSMTRVAYVTTEHTGGHMDINTAQGVIRLVTQQPDGVVVEAAGKTFNISKEGLALVGRFFLAAALNCGVADINADWDQPQFGGQPRD